MSTSNCDREGEGEAGGGEPEGAEDVESDLHLVSFRRHVVILYQF
jgi:hypothetical protein